MASFQIEILNPKAIKLLQDLADLELIAIRETADPSLQSIVDRIRTNTAGKYIPTEEEIMNEVEDVRAARYGKRKK